MGSESIASQPGCEAISTDRCILGSTVVSPYVRIAKMAATMQVLAFKRQYQKDVGMSA